MLGRARKRLLLVAGIFGGLVALVLGGLAAAVMTTPGARASIAALVKLVPSELVVGGVDGSIAGGLVLTDVRYESPELDAAFARVAIDAQLGALLEGRAVFSRLAAENGTVTLRESDSAAVEPADAPAELPAIFEWLAVHSLQIRDLAITGAADGVIAALDASVAGPQIALDRLEAHAGGGQIEATGEAHFGGDATARLEGSWVRPAPPSDIGRRRAARRARRQPRARDGHYAVAGDATLGAACGTSCGHAVGEPSGSFDAVARRNADRSRAHG
jgi:autotransporter translocation and assembly factor TamB